MSKTFSGKVALVTGADGGIGGAVANRLADKGATVVAGVRSRDVALMLDSYDVVELDLGDSDAIVRAVADIVERHGRLDILVNAAGSMPFKPLAELEPDDWRETLDVGLIGPVMVLPSCWVDGRV